MAQKIRHFVTENEMRKYSFQNSELQIEVTPKIFPPSNGAPLLLKSLEIRKGETVVDVGTGSGILAIAAAKMGGIVSATDNSKEAIRVARKNAELNNAMIDFREGSYFAGFGRKFDVIIANLPQEILTPSYRKAIGAELARTIDGGRLGNRHQLRFLDLAKRHSRENTRIYLPVFTAADYASTIKKMLSGYSARLVAFENLQTKEFVEANPGWFRQLNEEGRIRIFKRGKKWLAHAFVFELTPRNRNKSLRRKINLKN
jgi:release factor glutamine methyltransferase